MTQPTKAELVEKLIDALGSSTPCDNQEYVSSLLDPLYSKIQQLKELLAKCREPVMAANTSADMLNSPDTWDSLLKDIDQALKPVE